MRNLVSTCAHNHVNHTLPYIAISLWRPDFSLGFTSVSFWLTALKATFSAPALTLRPIYADESNKPKLPWTPKPLEDEAICDVIHPGFKPFQVAKFDEAWIQLDCKTSVCLNPCCYCKHLLVGVLFELYQT